MILLSRDKDEATRNTAFYTLQTWNPQQLQHILSNPATSSSTLDFVATYLVPKRKDLGEAILENPTLPADIREHVNETLASSSPTSGGEVSPTPTAAESPVVAGDENTGQGVAPTPEAFESPVAPDLWDEDSQDHKKMTLLQKIAKMTPSEKIKMALTGNMEERLLLIRDSNKLVARAVLGSPKLTDQEIENIASMKNVTEEVLRLISMNRKFMRTYAVVRQLINNPRTPIDVGMSLLHRINERDLKGLMLNKNIAEVIRGMALKMIKQREEAKKTKLPGK